MDVNKTPVPWRTSYAHPCAWEQDFPPLSLPDMFAAAAAEHGSKPLAEFFGRTWTYDALLAEARHFAAGLQARGIRPGDRVGLYLPNVPIYVPAYFGAMLAGATVVNFSPLYTVAELEAQVADSGTRLLVTVDLAKLLPTALTVLEGSALETLVVGRFCSMLPRLKGLAFRVFKRAELTALPPRHDVVAWDAMLHPAAPAPVPLDPATSLALLQYTAGRPARPRAQC